MSEDLFLLRSTQLSLGVECTAASSRHYQFAVGSISHRQRKSGLTGCTAAEEAKGQWPVWAVYVNSGKFKPTWLSALLRDLSELKRGHNPQIDLDTKYLGWQGRDVCSI